MWNKPWKMGAGFIIGGCVIIIGLLLQITIGGIEWGIFAAPVNYITLAILIAVIGAVYALGNKVYACMFLRTYQAAVPTLVYVVLLTMIMGLTRQQKDGQWLSDMLSFWPFVLIYLLMVIILGLVTINHCAKIIHQISHSKFHFSTFSYQLSIIFCHLGLFTVIVTATLGSADIERLKMVTNYGELKWWAYDEQHKSHELPIAIMLKKFILEEYDDGSPKRFASEVNVYTKSGKEVQGTIEVNKPLTVEGYKIYQYDYDQQYGAMSQISILEIVRDPWLPAVYTGIIILLTGAAGMMIWRKK